MIEKNVQLLLNSLDEGYRGPAWHGPSLRAALRGIDYRAAAQRPAAGRHNIWEVTVHSAFWKYAVRRRLLGAAQTSFPHRGRNWFERPSRDDGGDGAALAEAWRKDLALLAKTHADLRDTVAALQAASLDRASRGHRQTPRFMIAGIAMHDVYHAGQIQLLRRLLG